jgi:hypothetical protein
MFFWSLKWQTYPNSHVTGCAKLRQGEAFALTPTALISSTLLALEN